MSTIIIIILFSVQASAFFAGISALIAMLDPNGESPIEAVGGSFAGQYKIILEAIKIIGTSLFILVFLPFKLVEMTSRQSD